MRHSLTFAENVVVAVRRAEGADPALPLPCYQTEGAAGADVWANFPPDQRDGLTLAPGAWGLVPLGLHAQIPKGYEAQLRPRSGLALRHGISLLNSPATIDSDYRGALGAIMLNAGKEPFHIAHGLRVVQLVVAPVARARFALRDHLPNSPRGAGGFGSTGLR